MHSISEETDKDKVLSFLLCLEEILWEVVKNDRKKKHIWQLDLTVPALKYTSEVLVYFLPQNK